MRTMGVRVSLVLAAMVSTIVVGCSEDPTPARDQAATGVSLDKLEVRTRGELPACDASTEAMLAYVVDEKQIVACLDGSWQEVIFPDAPRGATGARGEPGAKGETGPKGDKGEHGAKGDHGERGAMGIEGAVGDVGAPGLEGAQGDKGETGDKGSKGAKGETGDKGAKGDTGAQGEAGDRGAAGAEGDKGPAGDKGDKGDTGTDGDKGDAGAVGFTSLVKSTTVGLGDAHCAGGGIRIDAGLDTNRNGALDPSEITQSAWVCKDAPPVRSRTIFVTSSKWTGNLGGVSGAHAKCQTAKAQNPAFASKSFKALIGSSTTKPSDYLATDGRFVRVDGTVVAKDWQQLLSSSMLDATINQTETGTVLTYNDAQQAWTGVVWGGTASANTCLNWTSSTGNFQTATGHCGTIAQTWHWWFNMGGGMCDFARALYCIEE